MHAAETTPTAESSAKSQTLSRGLRILETLAEHGGAMSLPELVAALKLHRSIVYRLLCTLEHHRMVIRNEHGMISLGLRLASLAASVEHDLHQAALPALRAAADDLGATCFLVAHDRGEVLTLVSTPPHRSIVAIAQNPGTSHPLGIGAPGRAILAQLPPEEWPNDLPPEVRAATETIASDGFTVSHNEVIPGLHSVSVPLRLPNHGTLALGVVYLSLDQPAETIADRLNRAASAIRDNLID
jgi:DNA-binding IclR family transcriptional regulator